ncbi:FAD-binding protein (plasmid) [Azospirillum brasilense]|uniref:FAD-binding protein n=1 Tax=Azospirillum brasilense TaxID=192 RepID=A0A4D8R759_AZOBR|nr:FAD-binding protein [Azospirillum brasilense]
MTAAIFARREGAQTILLEKHTELRGSTGLSIGSITATGTPHQRQAGIVDDPQAHPAPSSTKRTADWLWRWAGATRPAAPAEARRRARW